MLRIKRIALSLLWAGLAAQGWAQGLTNSPYGLYGLGDLISGYSARNQGMAGVNLATFDFTNVNRLNPASYADVGVTSIDVSGTYQATTARTDAREQRYRGGQLNALAFVFPTRKRFSIGLGLAPYSNIDYNVTGKQSTAPGPNFREFTTTSLGTGGLNELYLGAGFRIQKKITLGFNARYLFGNIREDWTFFSQTAGNTTNISVIRREKEVKGFGFTLGGQYTDTLTANWIGRVGVLAELPATLFNNQRISLTSTSSNGINTLSIQDTVSEEILRSTVPARYGIGFSTLYKSKLMLAADFLMQDWRSFTFEERSQDLTNSYRIALGAELVPSPNDRSYLKRVAYRAGLFYEQTYLRTSGANFANDKRNINNMGITAGLGLPLLRQYTKIHIGGAYGLRGTTQSGLISETYYQLFLGISFNEFWFVKRAYE